MITPVNVIKDNLHLKESVLIAINHARLVMDLKELTVLNVGQDLI